MQAEFLLKIKAGEASRKIHPNENINRKKYDCPCCNEYYFRKYLLISHIKKKHENMKFLCNECNLEFYILKGIYFKK